MADTDAVDAHRAVDCWWDCAVHCAASVLLCKRLPPHIHDCHRLHLLCHLLFQRHFDLFVVLFLCFFLIFDCITLETHSFFLTQHLARGTSRGTNLDSFGSGMTSKTSSGTSGKGPATARLNRRRKRRMKQPRQHVNLHALRHPMKSLQIFRSRSCCSAGDSLLQ